MQEYPIHAVIPELLASLAEANHAILSAPTGSGKSTIVPLELLHQPWLRGRSIIMLEPRRLATRACASRMADLLNQRVGETVGYRIRFDQRVSDKTRIEVVTEGILARRIQGDPELSGVGLIIFDEFHERNLQGDLALSLALDVATNLRDDLRLLVMSATLESDSIAALMGRARIIRGEGRSYPVQLEYLERESRDSIDLLVTRGVLRAIREHSGDILVFLPGVGEIRQVSHRIREMELRDIQICPLYGDLEKRDQDRALLPDPRGLRRVILATSIAETSLTIEGISVVVDSGRTRRPRFDPNTGLTRLVTERISHASADQRSGRAGRLGPGNCYRLWTEATHAGLKPSIVPEILDADLTMLVLELAQWGVSDIESMAWLDLPPRGAVAQSRELLQQLGAMQTNGRITPTGRQFLKLGIEPRLAAILIEAAGSNQARLGAELVTILSERDFLPRQEASRSVDIERRIQTLSHRTEKTPGDPSDALRSLRRSVKQMLKRLDSLKIRPQVDRRWTVGELLAAGFPDRIAQCQDRKRGSYRLVNGRRARLPEGDPLLRETYLVVAEMDAGEREGRIYRAASISLDEIQESQVDRIRQIDRVEWESQTQSVVSRSETRLGKLLLGSSRSTGVDPSLVRDTLLQGIRDEGIQSLNFTPEAQTLRQRVQLWNDQWQQDQLPDLSDAGLLETLDEWLSPYIEDGINRIQQLNRLDLHKILMNHLSWEQQQQLEQQLPTHIRVPSGSRKRIDYSAENGPVLAVRLQEMFGCSETPTLCGGRLPLMLHLLSPAQRPIQVTRDLAGFWQRTYAEVKRELKGRYPKHHWPDDPLSAQPTARTKPATR